MHNLSFLAVGNVWFVGGLIVGLCAAVFGVFASLCRNNSFVRKLSTANTQAYPQPNYVFNRLVLWLTHINHRTNKNDNYLFKLITINALEKL